MLTGEQATAHEYQGDVYQSMQCGCCDVWSSYAQRDIDLEVSKQVSIDHIKDEYEIPQRLRSCHTTVIEEYYIEGHIPMQAIDKLLEERPDIAGIALPGMPSGTPGMPGPKSGDWIIYAINHDGTSYEFMRI